MHVEIEKCSNVSPSRPQDEDQIVTVMPEPLGAVGRPKQKIKGVEYPVSGAWNTRWDLGCGFKAVIEGSSYRDQAGACNTAEPSLGGREVGKISSASSWKETSQRE